MYTPFKSLVEIIKSLAKERPISRRDAIIGALEAITSVTAATVCTTEIYHALSSSVPSIDDVEAVAKYINSHIAPVESRKKNGELLIYIFPDIHATSFHKRHKKIIDKLHEKLGLSLVGLEGETQGVVINQQHLHETLSLVKELQSLGIYHQLAKNEVMFSKKEPRKVESMEDLLEVAPLYHYAKDGSQIILFGLESEVTGNEGLAHNTLKIIYELYYSTAHRYAEIIDLSERQKAQIKRMEAKKKHYESKKDYKHVEETQKAIETFKSDTIELKQLSEKVQKKRKKLIYMMDKERKKLPYILPDYDENIENARTMYHTPFYNALREHSAKNTMDKRSIDCVKIATDEMKTRNSRQCAVVFGEAHKDQITAECNRLNSSYIVFSPYY